MVTAPSPGAEDFACPQPLPWSQAAEPITCVVKAQTTALDVASTQQKHQVPSLGPLDGMGWFLLSFLQARLASAGEVGLLVCL